jgi:hypothetical protein
MLEEKTPVTHWKKLTNPNYVGAHDLQPGQELTVTIECVSTEMVKNDKGEATSCIVMKFKGATKPMIVNKTNCKIIEQVLDTPYIEKWAGGKIIIYAAKVAAFGKMTDALRVKNQKPS